MKTTLLQTSLRGAAEIQLMEIAPMTATKQPDPNAEIQRVISLLRRGRQIVTIRPHLFAPRNDVWRFVRKTGRGWGYVNRLKQIAAQMQCRKEFQVFINSVFEQKKLLQRAQKLLVTNKITIIMISFHHSSDKHQPLSFSNLAFSLQTLTSQ